MNIAFLADPLDQFKIHKDTTYAMMVEASSRGHGVYAFQQNDMAIHGGSVVANVARVVLKDDPNDWFCLEPAQPVGLNDFQAVIVRKDPPFNMEYVYMTYLLELAERAGAHVLNKPQAVRDHNEKLAIMQFPGFMAPTLVSSDEARLRQFHREHKDIILKPLDGMGGAGVFRISEDGMNLGSVIEMLSNFGTRTIMAQRYIPAIVAGDKRILLIGGSVVPYCLARIPQCGEVRGNLAAGGRGVANSLSPRDLEIAQSLAPSLFERGLSLVGLDVIGDYLTEVNVTSPTCFQEIRQQTGFNVAAMFMDFVEECREVKFNKLSNRQLKSVEVA